MAELEELQSTWMDVTGEPMPAEIAGQPIELVRKAVKWRKCGVTVAVPRLRPMGCEQEESSMQDWDRQDDKNGNAY